MDRNATLDKPAIFFYGLIGYWLHSPEEGSGGDWLSSARSHLLATLSALLATTCATATRPRSA